jgi:imidazolonepropionase-like amidohydrolase
VSATHVHARFLPGGVARDAWVADGRLTFQPVDDAPTIVDEGWIVPGLVDAHAHLALASPAPGPVREAIGASARAQLEAGVLFVREPGSPAGDLAADLGDELPGTVTAGRFLAPPGRYFPGLAEEVADADLAAAAGAHARAGAWVKVIGDWFDDEGRAGPNWSAEALREAREAAHAAGARITMHATIPPSLEQAIEAGFDCVEHGHGLTPEHATAMAAIGMAFVPTLIIGEPIRELVGSMPITDDTRERWLAHVDGHPGAVRAAAEAGVAVYAGTDAGMVPHGLVGQEIALLRDAGLPGDAALAAGSWAARAWLGLPGLEEGAPADLVAFPDDPRDDPRALSRPSLIMRAGRVVGPR